MITWPITREDISVWRDKEGTLWIKVGDDMNNFMVSSKGEGSTMSAILQMMEMLNHKVLGVTQHDFIMKVNDLFIQEKETNEV